MKRRNYNCQPFADPTANKAINSVMCDNAYAEGIFNARNKHLNELMCEMQELAGGEYDLLELTLFDRRTHKKVTRKFR